MQSKLKKIRTIRKFSEEFKKSLVTSYEKGEYSVYQLSKLYFIATTQIYNWIYKYSKFNEKGIIIVEMKSSSEQKIRDLFDKVKFLEQTLGQKQIQIDYLEKMIDLAKDDLGIDIKKNYNTQPSSGLKKTNKK